MTSVMVEFGKLCIRRFIRFKKLKPSNVLNNKHVSVPFPTVSFFILKREVLTFLLKHWYL